MRAAEGGGPKETPPALLKRGDPRAMKLPELADVFEKACQIPAGSGAMRLLETGTFAFSGKPVFYIPLVRQHPGGEAYVRLHL